MCGYRWGCGGGGGGEGGEVGLELLEAHANPYSSSCVGVGFEGVLLEGGQVGVEVSGFG